MSLGRTLSVAVIGLHGTVIDVEADTGAGLPTFTVGGMPDAACRQSPDRIRAATANSELGLPKQRITINLSPASLPKQGAGFDLAIAVAAMTAGGMIDPNLVESVVHLGELALDGSLRPITGVLPAVMAAADAGVREVVLPLRNAAEAALVPNITIVPMRSLRDVWLRYEALRKRRPILVESIPERAVQSVTAQPDLAEIAGQQQARYALEVAAAGGHHMAMIGPPGAGKTMIAQRLPSLLPPLSRSAALEVTTIHSVLGVLTDQVLVDRAPFVAPHHGASMAAMTGGGSGRVRPGAISRAHHGVLFLDETPEFRRDVLEALRQPLECGVVTVARVEGTLTFPAQFQLLVAANPCPCGNFYGTGSKCTCSPMQRRAYEVKLKGPFMDRVDVQLQMFPVSRASLSAAPREASASVAARVQAARERQAQRWSDVPWTLNSEAPGPALRDSRWRLASTTTRLLDAAMDRGRVTLRGYDRCLRLAWTLADLQTEARPGPGHIAEAMTLRAVTESAA